jgi:tRNA-splicing ligase RtcB (3'-phosphate/5'-hydroxy nucleic acid ligase)
MFDSRVSRTDETRLEVKNPFSIPTTIFANEAVPLERKAIDELLGLLEVQATLEKLQKILPEAYPESARLERVILTPDLHKAQGIPVGTVMQTTGFVIPQAMGNDINCGMRLHKTNLRSEAVLNNLDKLEKRLRHLFFEGGRRIPMTGLQRQALLQNGLTGLLEAVPKTQVEGLWQYWHDQNLSADFERTEQHGSIQAASIVNGLEDWIGDLHSISRDAQIGSLGGGNHFAEVQRVAKILDPVTAHAWGLKPDNVVVMIHSGSVGIGHLAGSQLKTATRAAYPKGIAHPENGIYPMPLHSENWHDALANAANFAFANRVFLALMVRAALEETVSATDYDLLYDAPHNLVWQQEHGALHRKGATPARGFEAMQNTPFAYHGEPVLIPGSMGASSYVLAGTGNTDNLESASHGAGRIHSRGEAMRGSEQEFKDFLERYRVVTPLDWNDPRVKTRPDIVREHLANLRQEAPFAYKGITSIIETQTAANMVRGVVELEPLLTVKG